LRILLFLNNDIHAAKALDFLLPSLKKHQVKIILSQKVGNVENLPSGILKMKNFEKVEFSWEKFGFEIASFPNVNSENSLAIFKKFAPDLIVSIRFGQILKQPLINIPRLGVLNLHSGILPKYRGVLASFWAILNGEKNIGMTLHYITDSGIDNGDVIAFSEKKIDWDSSLFLNINGLYESGCGALSQAIERISDNKKIITEKQEEFGLAQYFSYPKESDVKKFLKLMPLVKDGDREKISII
jgi:methionyl-tRNA formyltransferase